MTEEIKYLIFKGIEKKEQILFKSFLNLAKNELEYQIIVLKDKSPSENIPSVAIVDGSYEFPADEKTLEALPSVVVGDDLSNEDPWYITRPVQWSDFRAALTEFSSPTSRQTPSEGKGEEVAAPVFELSLEEDDGSVDALQEAERLLPAEVMFAIDEVDEETQPVDDDEFEPINHEYELDNMSVDYNSHTNSDYMKVVDDVQQFKVNDDEVAPGAMLLVTDDESNSTNSVLVIETNSLDAWDFSVTEASSSEADAVEDAKEAVADIASLAFSSNETNAVVQPKSGFDLAVGEKYWLEDNEIIANEVSVLYVKSQRSMVYSSSEPGKWVDALQGKKLSKLPLKDDWRPKKGLTAYPLSSLVWVNTLMSDTAELADGLKSDADYILERWPHFDLLQLDNVLLKLCSMMFVNAESLNSLVEKSGYSRSTVRGLMNACFEQGILKKAGDVQVEDLVAAGNDGVFGKIKDVFR